jgi:serine/threonine protein kinase
LCQPERISGQEYSVQADVWALGLTLIELAWKYPYPDALALFELLQCVVSEAPPSLPTDAGFSLEFQDFVRVWYFFLSL